MAHLYFFVVAGTVLGAVASAIGLAVSRRLGSGGFWRELPEITRALVASADSSKLATAYARLLREVGRYVGRNLLIVGLALSPVVLAVVGLGPWALRLAVGEARVLATFGLQPESLELAGTILVSGPDGAFSVPPGAPDGPLRVVLAGREFEFDDWRRSNACATSSWRSIGLQLLGFNVQSATSPVSGALLIRPLAGHTNWFWPWLSDAETAYYLAVMTGSLCGRLVIRNQKR